MGRTKPGTIIRGLAILLLLLVFLVLSNWLVPTVSALAEINPYYFLSWGAPAIFYENIDTAGAFIKLEPWRLLGLQLPAFAGIQPKDWAEATTPPPHSSEPGTVSPQKPDAGVVGIYHSHASEAFVPSTGQARSADFSQTVVQLGRRIKEILEQNDIAVMHNEEYHDRDYSQSYINSRDTVQNMLDQQGKIIMLIDLHRDGVGSNSAKGRAVTTATVNGMKAGQIMFVISSAHANWEKNNRLALDLHNLLENKYPGLSRGILSRSNSAYNQDMHSGAILVEIGGHWNSLDEAIYGAELFAEVLADYIVGGNK